VTSAPSFSAIPKFSHFTSDGFKGDLSFALLESVLLCSPYKDTYFKKFFNKNRVEIFRWNQGEAKNPKMGPPC
jgi:hypothetical protein